MGLYDAFKEGAEFTGGLIQQRNNRKLADLYAGAYSAPREQRAGLLGQAAQLGGPGAAKGLQESFGGIDDDLRSQLSDAAAAVLSAPPEQRDAAYKQYALPLAKQLGKPAPESWNDGLTEHFQKMAGVKPEADSTPADIRSLQMLQQNPELMALYERKARAGWRPDIRSADDGSLWATDPNTLNSQPVQFGGGRAPVSGGGAMLMGDAIQSVESAGNPQAVSPKGARGLMQLMPETAREIEQALGMPPGETDRNPDANRQAGEWYYQQQLQRFGDPQLALAAYNGGPGRMDRNLKAAGGDPRAALSRMPAETQAYVPKVMGRAQGGAPMAAGPSFGRKKDDVQESFDRIGPDEIKAMGLPSGTVAQRSTKTGKVDIISKPDKPTERAAKPLPANIVNTLTKQAETSDNLGALTAGFKDEFAGNSLTGSLENRLGRLGVPGVSEGQAEWWQQYDRQKNVVRNELFGASLTPGEQAAFEAADITPAMSPAVIRKNLAMQQQIIQRGLARQSKVWTAQGYNADAVTAATAPMAPAPQAPANNGWSIRRK